MTQAHIEWLNRNVPRHGALQYQKVDFRPELYSAAIQDEQFASRLKTVGKKLRLLEKDPDYTQKIQRIQREASAKTHTPESRLKVFEKHLNKWQLSLPHAKVKEIRKQIGEDPEPWLKFFDTYVPRHAIFNSPEEDLREILYKKAKDDKTFLKRIITVASKLKELSQDPNFKEKKEWLHYHAVQKEKPEEILSVFEKAANHWDQITAAITAEDNLITHYTKGYEFELSYDDIKLPQPVAAKEDYANEGIHHITTFAHELTQQGVDQETIHQIIDIAQNAKPWPSDSKKAPDHGYGYTLFLERTADLLRTVALKKTGATRARLTKTIDELRNAANLQFQDSRIKTFQIPFMGHTETWTYKHPLLEEPQELPEIAKHALGTYSIIQVASNSKPNIANEIRKIITPHI